MAKKEKKEVVEKIPNEPKGDVTKIKAEMQKPGKVIEEAITKVDLNNPPIPKEDEVEESNADDSGVVASTEDANAPQEQEEVQPEAQTQETPILEDITGEVEEVTDVASVAIKESMATGKPLPDNVQKLMDFMEDTGGDLNDYVKLNQDYGKMDNQDLLHEFYKQTKPHLDSEEINFLMEDQFSFDEDVDDDREIKRKKLALKEHVVQAKQHLDGAKSKYYEDIKSGSKLTEEQQEAVKYFNKHTKEAEATEAYEKHAKSNFLNKTNRFFGDQFKGFEYEIGEKKFRFKVNDVEKVKDTQSDINNFIGKFLDKDNQMADEAGYHKSLFTAMNSDAVANHFYEQGRSDALKQSIDDSKNVNMKPRQELGTNQNQGGFQARVLGDTTADFKFKIKNKK